MYFAKETNSEWLYFKATETGTLGFVIKPMEPGKNFDFVVYKKTGTSFASDVVDKRILPLRSNLAKPIDTTSYDSTGLGCLAESEFEGVDANTHYSKPIQVEKDSVYYICVNHTHSAGKGYALRLFYCGAGEAGTQIVDSTALQPAEPMPTLPQAEPNKATSTKPASHVEKCPPLQEGEECYTVAQGNTVYSIATEHGMRVIELCDRNRLVGHKIYIGQRLAVAIKGSRPPITAEAKPAPSVPEPKAVVSQPAPTQAPATSPEVTPAPTKPTPAPAEPAAPASQPKTEPAPEPAKEQPTDLASRPARTSLKPTSNTPAAPSSIEAKNAVAESIQKLWVYDLLKNWLVG
jgi:LysM repeat protein